MLLPDELLKTTPTWQAWHELASAPHIPAEQTQLALLVLPVASVVDPAGQLVQVTLPTNPLYVPSGHSLTPVPPDVGSTPAMGTQMPLTASPVVMLILQAVHAISPRLGLP